MFFCFCNIFTIAIIFVVVVIIIIIIIIIFNSLFIYAQT